MFDLETSLRFMPNATLRIPAGGTQPSAHDSEERYRVGVIISPAPLIPHANTERAKAYHTVPRSETSRRG